MEKRKKEKMKRIHHSFSDAFIVQSWEGVNIPRTRSTLSPKDSEWIQNSFQEELLHREGGMSEALVHFQGWRGISSSGSVRNELNSPGDRVDKCNW